MTFLTVQECLDRLPVKVAERRFRKDVRELGLCYKNGWQITLSEDHLRQYIETLDQCQTSTSQDAKKVAVGTSGARSRSQARKKESSFARARALLAE